MNDETKTGGALGRMPGKKRKSPKGAMRRETILAAAMQHFAKDGYQSASFASIAADAGLSLPGLLHYFPTKVDLLLAVLEKRDLESTSAVGPKYEDWRRVLLGLVDVARLNQDIPNVVQAFAVLNAESLTADHPASRWFALRASNLTDNLVFSLRKGISDGEIKPDIDPSSIAAELIGMMDGLQMLWLRYPGEIDMVMIFSGYINRLIEAIELR
ncbi:TetR/AcrR family transcriptional regulator [Agrobacterium vaccinii]|uniref:TetR/AcrR family transcriptional regulator n=1 Tax=Agrobacterium vaccinii TaxID=2735528 RepID=UPI001E3140C5|nr:TetR/AcrR family transcriptional regulator [Agrobacterium vaccinii]UHS63156.1 TetR/AcrR family transcriptional regulator [Agrobacterium vaccinii]